MTDTDHYLAPAGLDEPWRDRAACAGKGTTVFYPQLRGHADQAIVICRSCTVRPDCLVAAAAATCTWQIGVWGGTTPIDRRGLTRRDAYAGAYGDPLTDPTAQRLMERYREQRRADRRARHQKVAT